MIRRLTTLVVLAAGAFALSAQASPLTASGMFSTHLGGAQDAQPFLTTTGNNDNAMYMPSNAEKDGTVRIRVLTSAGNFTCSGSVIGLTSILTAAHCVNIPGATVSQVQVYFGGGSAASGLGATGLGPYTGRAPDRLVSSFVTNPHYFDPVYGAGAGNPVVGIGDLAVLTLDSSVPASTRILGLYAGDPLARTAEHIAYGSRGTGAAGSNIGVDLTALFEGRKGSNVYDNTYEGVFQDLANGLPAPASPELLDLVKNSQLLYDFDPLTPVVDRIWGGPLDGISFWKALADNGYSVFLCPAGTVVPGFGTCVGTELINPQIDLANFAGSLGLQEALIAGGDSGGAALIDGMVAGVHSFGTTLSASFCRRFINAADLLCGNNSSFGDLAGDTNVALYRNWILAQVVPAPGSAALLGVALLALAAVRRRRAA